MNTKKTTPDKKTSPGKHRITPGDTSQSPSPNSEKQQPKNKNNQQYIQKTT